MTRFVREIKAGTLMRWLSKDFKYRPELFETCMDEQYIHTYSYPESGIYGAPKLPGGFDIWLCSDLTFPEDCIVRLSVKSATGEDSAFVEGSASGKGEVPPLEELAKFESPGEAGEKPRAAGGAETEPWLAAVSETEPWLAAELERFERAVSAAKEDGGKLMFLLSDTHYSPGANWPRTLAHLKLAAERLHPDCVIHLGDLTDGMLPLEETKVFAKAVKDGLENLGVPVHICIGNHDTNYFRGNPYYMGLQEARAFYCTGGRSAEQPDYYTDIQDAGLRMIFLESFDPLREERYGFSDQTAEWFKKTLRETPEGLKILVFSHVTPVARMHCWSDTIRLGEEMIELCRGNKNVTGWIFGHNHCDQTEYIDGMPFLSIGSSKTEDFRDHKPYASTTYRREQGSLSEDLWYALIVKKDGGLELFHFGAGEDRSIKRDTSR